MSAFRETLLSGSYNLLLGSGVSLDSENGRGEKLRDSEQLRLDLCKITGAPDATKLHRVYPLLTDPQRDEELVKRFSDCQPGPSLRDVPRFLWRRAFTFNIDDVLEKVYETTPLSKQTIIPLNFDSPLEPTPVKGELHAVHLHGWVRRPDRGFVFSYNEYSRIMRDLNPWMHLLGEILATEPFIIAGTSLDEPDLEFYLSSRNSSTPRRDRGPSLLIEPYPNVITTNDCARYSLLLIPATMQDFMDWLRVTFPSPPTIYDLTIPDESTLFSSQPSKTQLLRFFSDFKLVTADELPLPSTPSSFMYGRTPEWDDINRHFDIERQDTARLTSIVEQCFTATGTKDPRILITLDEPGTGKTTVIKRIAHARARMGKPVLTLQTLSRIDTHVAIYCLSCLSSQALLLVDGIADHIEQIAEILDQHSVSSKVVVLGADRSYRKQYLDVVLGESQWNQLSLLPFSFNECEQLIERYRQFGLVGAPRAIKKPQEFANRIYKDPVAIAICRILNDFRPLDLIIESLIAAATPEHHLPYLCVALAQHCYSAGLRYSSLQAIAGLNNPIANMFDSVPLRLARNPNDNDFVVPINKTIGERVLLRSAEHMKDTLREAFVRLAAELAPHVNRKAIMSRSPEARLAGRLFDADKIVKPLLADAAERFYIDTQKKWEWNSRYWEQRALLTADFDLDIALQYARHAVAVELHPFPLTTLAKILLMLMEARVNERQRAFGEALENLSAAITSEKSASRVTIHPYVTLFTGVARYLELGETLTPEQTRELRKFVIDARIRFSRDRQIQLTLLKLNNIAT